MGCMTSKSSNQQQHEDPVIIPSHHYIFPSNTNHTVDDLLKLIPPKHDHIHNLTDHTVLKTDDPMERCLSFHTVEEYDELLQRISNHNDAELAGGPIPIATPVLNTDTTDIACKNDSNIEIRDKEKQEMEFQTVASLRQWLHATGGIGGDADAAMEEHATSKVGFSFYEYDRNGNSSNIQGPEENSVLVKTGKQEEEESIVELVAAFDKYMQQLQIDEDNILKQIHHMIN